jgi:hypothetical protein
MKIFALVFGGLLVVGLIYLFIKGGETQEIRTEIEIAAPPAKVWSLLVDVDKWHEWSPIIKKSVGQASMGTELDITMMAKEGDGDGPNYKPKITELRENKHFRWRAHMMAAFLFTNDKVFDLEETATGTKVVHKELFTGMLAPLFCGQMEVGVPPMLNSMNAALKVLAEK